MSGICLERREANIDIKFERRQLVCRVQTSFSVKYNNQRIIVLRDNDDVANNHNTTTKIKQYIYILVQRNKYIF